MGNSSSSTSGSNDLSSSPSLSSSSSSSPAATVGGNAKEKAEKEFPSMNQLVEVDSRYDEKMASFEVDCSDGNGEPIACHHVGEYYSVVKDDHKRAAGIYDLNCKNKNHAPSCFNLAKLILAGKGMPQSDCKAEELFGKACKDNHWVACYHQAALMYLEDTPETASSAPAPSADEPVYDERVKMKRKAEGLTIFERACKEGNTDSCYIAGSHYISPKHTDRNPLKAVEYLDISCRKNHAKSCYNLAVMFRNGDKGIEKNSEKFEEYKEKTNQLAKLYGGLNGKRKG